MEEGIIFVVLTLALAYISRASLLVPGSHGFYRFFAWECMVVMYVLNIRVWYVDTEDTHQNIVSAFFYTALLLVVSAVILLKTTGKPDAKRNDAPMLGFEKTTALVTTGIYRYIRHPMYSSLLLFAWGIFFKQPSVIGGILAVISNVFMIATARAEEKENIRYFGEEYREYMKKSKMFIPFIL